MFYPFNQLNCVFDMFLGKNEQNGVFPQVRPEIPVLSQLQSYIWSDSPHRNNHQCYLVLEIITHLHIFQSCFSLVHLEVGLMVKNILKQTIVLRFLIVFPWPMFSHGFLWFSHVFPMVSPWFARLRAGPGQDMGQVVQVEQPLGHLGR